MKKDVFGRPFFVDVASHHCEASFRENGKRQSNLEQKHMSWIASCLAMTVQKKAAENSAAFRRSGPTRTGDRLHPMQEC